MATAVTYGQPAHGSSRFEDRRRKAQGIPIEIAALCDSPIAFHRALVKPAGGPLEALFLSQALYWAKRTDDPDGWFWKTSAEWEDETGIGRHQQDGIRDRLRKLGILEEERRGMPARLYFRINLQLLADLVLNCNADKNAVLRQSRMPVCGNHDVDETANKYKEQETTSETTALEALANDQPLVSADDLTYDDLDPIARTYSGGAPGPAWCKQFKKQPQVLIALGFTVRRSDLMSAAVSGRAKHEQERGGPPRILDYFDKALDALVRSKQTPQTTTTTLSAAEIERNQREAAERAKQKIDVRAMVELGMSQIEITELMGAAA